MDIITGLLAKCEFEINMNDEIVAETLLNINTIKII